MRKKQAVNNREFSSDDQTTIIDLGRAYPFLKWAGGKRALVPNIIKELPPEFGTYYEPFVGGGAVFFALESKIQKTAYLSDMNQELIVTYQTLKEKPKQVIKELEKHESKHNREYYHRIREDTSHDPVTRAARCIYLNKTCYNGLYRVNSKNRFNVPMGSYRNPKICDKENLLAVSKVLKLKKTKLRFHSFEKIKPKKGDLVYCDPPYDETFTHYTGSGFSEKDQSALRDACKRWRKAGVFVIVSNSDTPLIRELYQDFHLISVQAPRFINCKGNERTKVSELLILGY